LYEVAEEAGYFVEAEDADEVGKYFFDLLEYIFIYIEKVIGKTLLYWCFYCCKCEWGWVNLSIQGICHL
jgi:hypothetical protein